MEALRCWLFSFNLKVVPNCDRLWWVQVHECRVTPNPKGGWETSSLVGYTGERKCVGEQPASLFATLGIARRKGFNTENEVLTKSLQSLGVWHLEAAIEYSALRSHLCQQPRNQETASATTTGVISATLRTGTSPGNVESISCQLSPLLAPACSLAHLPSLPPFGAHVSGFCSLNLNEPRSVARQETGRCSFNLPFPGMRGRWWELEMDTSANRLSLAQYLIWRPPLSLLLPFPFCLRWLLLLARPSSPGHSSLGFFVFFFFLTLSGGSAWCCHHRGVSPPTVLSLNELTKGFYSLIVPLSDSIRDVGMRPVSKVNPS